MAGDWWLLVAWLIVTGSSILVSEATAVYPIGDAHNCQSISPQDATQSLNSLDILPGLGFDALRNIDMGPVLNYNYSLCQVSKDGMYLLPDNMYLSPVRESRVNVYADYFDHWDQYTSLTSKTINAHASLSWSFASIGGSYSSEHTTTKEHMVNDDSTTARIYIRNKLYVVHAQPRSPLHPMFKSRIFEIAAYLEKNETDRAYYLAELLVRDYGTHYLTAVEAGAIIAQTDYISRKYTEDKSSDSTTITASASASFFGIFSAGGGIKTTTKNTHDDGYIGNRTFSTIDTIGGPPFRINFTIDQWEAGIPEALVPTDRAGDPLHFAINSDTVPELPYAMRGAVTDVVFEAMKRYFQVNTHAGCTNPRSKHFDFNANVDDGSCDAELVHSNYTFGGAYQICSGSESQCSGHGLFNQPNPLTHGYSCPDNTNYIPVKMFSGIIDTRVIIRYFWFFPRVIDEHIPYETYWCVARPEASIPENSGFLFGGFYTDTTPNPLTNTLHCPPYFTPLKIGNYLHICVSTDFELGYRYSVPFGGFDTCQSGNPLTRQTFSENQATWPHECPHGYTRYFGGVEHGCDINLCVKSGTLKATNFYTSFPPRLPPFHHRPQVKQNTTDHESLTFLGSDGNIWTRNWQGEWSNNEEPSSQCFADTTTEQGITTKRPSTVYTTPDPERTETTTTQNSGSNPLKSDGPSTVAVTLPTVLIGVLVLCVVVILIAIVAFRAHKRHRGHGYNNILHTSNQASDLNTQA